MDGDVQQKILDELRIQSAMFRKANKINIGVTCVFLAVIAAFVALTPFIQSKLYSPTVSTQRTDSWQEARTLIDQGEYQKGQEMLQRLIKRHPDYYYGYAVLGSLHQELGNMKEAEANYSKAYDLFPTEDNKKTVTALRTILEKNKTANK